MKRSFITLALSLALTTAAHAKTPKEVLDPYKAYLVALKVNDKNKAADFAYEAWQQAEKLMDDSKTTGDLAANFAELRPRYIDEKLAWKLVMEAHKRSIDLASLYEEDATTVEVDRRTKYLSWLIPNLTTRAAGARDKKYSFKRLSERIEEFGLKGTTYDAESMAFSALSAMMDKDWKTAERDSIAAMGLFDSRTDGLVSVYEFAVPIYLARAYAEQNQLIDAAVTYQNLITKMETKGGHNNSISSDAYGEWIQLRDEISKMKTDDPRAKDVLGFVVPNGRAKELTPLLRKPPVFPSSFLQGNNSGFVKVRFNIDLNGHVIDPVIVSSTNKTLHKATLKSLEGWRYTPNLPEVRSKDIEVKVNFDVRNVGGSRLPYGKERVRP